MVPGSAEPAERHVSSAMFRCLFPYLAEDSLNPARMEEIIRLAEETRSAAELLEPSAWNSYQQYRKLLEAVEGSLGGPSALAEAAVESARRFQHRVLFARFEGSPADAFAAGADSYSSISPIHEVETAELEPNHWSVKYRVIDGFEPFPAACTFTAHVWRSTPLWYGLAPAVMDKVSCQCQGDEWCEVRLRWTDVDDAQLQVAHLQSRADAAEARFDLLSATVVDLVTSDALEVVLPKIVAAAAAAVIAPTFVLAAEAPFVGRLVYGHGASQEQYEQVAELVFNDEPLPANMTAVDIESIRRLYGRLVAIKRNERPMLPTQYTAFTTYAQLAAAALDSAEAVSEACQQAATAEVLLELSMSLSGASTVVDVCERITRAVPTLIDCDQARLYLFHNEHAELVATVGGSEASRQFLIDRPIPMATGLPRPNQLIRLHRHSAPPTAALYMDVTGVTSTTAVPIVSGREVIGILIAAVEDDHRRLDDAPHISERLFGLAGQAAAAITNARLLERIRHQALHDSLTGLPNRALLLDRTERMLARARREAITAGALFVDLDNFKDINDTLGHGAGDEVLQQVAGRFKAALRETDTVARVGGDEFVVLVEAASLAEGPDTAALRIAEALREPFWLTGVAAPVTVTASVGVAMGDRTSASDLLRDADIALYEAKAAGRNRHVIFQPEMLQAVQHRHDR